MEDAGKHYRFEYKVNITLENLADNYVTIKLDPFRIAKIYGMEDFAMQTILKKVLCAGNRGNKSFEQDLLDIVSAAQRRLEILNEDKSNE